MKFNNIICWTLLAYFALVIVPPVSTFVSSQRITSSREAGHRLVQDHQRAPLFLFDIILWQKLKKAKHSEEFIVSFPGNIDFDRTHMQSCDNDALVPPRSDSSEFIILLGDVSLIRQSRSSYIHFSRSGVSPPAFSS